MRSLDPIQIALPFFILFIVIEMAWARRRNHEGYEPRDTLVSMLLGLGNTAIGLLAAGAVTGAMFWLYRFRPFTIGWQWWAWPLCFVLDDFNYYWSHRAAHRIRWMWASHVNHHSSQHYNLSTALRQTWTGHVALTFLFRIWPALLGFHPGMIVTVGAFNLIYQFWIHTEAIRSIGPLEQVLNSPSLHRVHHGSNRRYLDRNHGSILIVWDRLFGTHQVEDEPVVYGLTRNIETCNPARIATHELADIVTDVAASTTWRDRLSFVLRGPGWAYARRAR